MTITLICATIPQKEDFTMAVSKDKTGVLVNMDKTLKEKLTELAKKQNRSLSNLIVTVLQNYVESTDE